MSALGRCTVTKPPGSANRSAVAGPIIPYIPGQEYEIPLRFLEYIPLLGDWVDSARPPSIKPFGTLVALGVWAGSMVTLKRTRDRDLDEMQMNDFIFWVVAAGFVISHMLDAIFYHPQRVMADPLYLLRIWDGLSSYGGFIGALVGAVAWKVYRRKAILEYVDITVSAFPLAWVFGRTGCSLVHDHPGAASNAWFAVRYPASQLPAGFEGRFDLGLYEMLLTIPLAIACHMLWKRKPKRAAGFYVGVTLTCYAPVRFLLDYLRVQPNESVRLAADPRYGGLTPAQWACFAAMAVGLYFLRKTLKQPYLRLGDLAPAGGDLDELAAGDEDDHDPFANDAEDEESAAPKQKPGKKKKKRRKKKKAAAKVSAAKDEQVDEGADEASVGADDDEQEAET